MIIKTFLICMAALVASWLLSFWVGYTIGTDNAYREDADK